MRKFQLKHSFFFKILFVGTALYSALFSRADFAGEESPEEVVTGRIDSVTVFADRAQIRRVAAVRMEGAQKVLRFVSLPASLVPDSVRATGEGLAVSSVSIRPARPMDETALNNHPLKRKLLSLAQEMRLETDKQNIAKEQLRVLGSFGQYAGNQTDRELRQSAIRTQDWGEALRFLEEKRVFYMDRIRKSEDRMDDLRQEIKLVTEQFAKISQTGNRSSFDVEVICSGPAQSQGNVSIEYTVTGVSWTGIYDLHGSSEGGDFRLESRVALKQSTGEDWSNVSLTLSTARPSTGMSPGLLRPWRIGPGSFHAVDHDVDQGETRETGGDRFSGGGDNSASFSLLLPGHQTIPGDNSERRITLQSASIHGDVAYVAVPSLSSSVFMRASLKNTTESPLIWTSVNVFIDGTFMGSVVPGRRAAVGEEFDLYLGPDQRMQAKRVLIRGDVVGTGILSKKVEIRNQWQIEISNHTRKTRRIIVMDRFPVSADPNLTLKFQGSSRSDVKADANGILSWNLDVNAGETQKFDFTYSIEIPQEMWDRIEQTEKERDQSTPVDQLQESPSAAPRSRVYNIEKMF